MSSDFESTSTFTAPMRRIWRKCTPVTCKTQVRSMPNGSTFSKAETRRRRKNFLTEQQGASWAPRTTSVIGGNGDTPSMSDATAGMERPQFPPHMMGMPYMPIAAAPEQIRQATMDQSGRSC